MPSHLHLFRELLQSHPHIVSLSPYVQSACNGASLDRISSIFSLTRYHRLAKASYRGQLMHSEFLQH